jgi:hypothetical protein
VWRPTDCSKIVAPAAARLAGKHHVFIAAGGSLSSLPFGLLVTEKPQGSDGDPSRTCARRNGSPMRTP